MSPSLQDLILEGRERLSNSRLALVPREANLLLAHVMGWTESELLARDDLSPTEAQVQSYRSALSRRARREPIAYILGRKEFYGRTFRVDNRVLIPRPETEHLVEEVLKLQLGSRPTLLDIGTGSGCLAVTLALEIPGSRVIATDLSLAASAVAVQNARNHRVDSRIDFVAADLTSGLDLQGIDLVVSNPPYIATSAASDLSPEILDFEPHAAIFAGSEGDDLMRRLLDQLRRLRSGVWIVLEIGFDQEARLRDLASGSRYRSVAVSPDYAGRPRVARFRRA
ncbi:MAG: peptide chain release factor N(5)-glutamine methyltransferase [Acidobacteriota bacterium]